ncbi:MAG: nucleotidyltransferase domain-containing protein [Elusimicrobiota bacterium]
MRNLNMWETIDRIKKIVVEKINPERIILFGSGAKGEMGKDSDIDLLIVRETDLKPNKRAAGIRSLIRPYSYPLDIIVYTPSEFDKYKDVPGSFLNDTLEEGKILYERIN